MNIYRFMVLSSLLKSVSSIHVNRLQNRALNLYMKKGKNNFSEFYIPKSDNQNKYLEYLNHNKCKIVISIGPAGTGKTMFACQSAVTLLKKEEINKIIITRPVVTVEEEIGFLPGNIIKKMDPWTKPIFDIFMEHFSKSDLDIMLNSNKIEICPLAFMRGRTFKNAFIIADEMQNSSPSQMKMLTTRLGDNSKMVITGDLKQSDIQTENGLNDLITRLKKYENINNSTELINIIEFDNSDIERSEIVKKVIDIYDLQEFKKSDNIDTNLQNSTIVLCKEETKEETKEKPKNINSDCALIPKHYVSHNFDIFFPPKDF